MIEFKLKTYKKEISEIPDRICDIFQSPMIFYLANKDDKRLFFVTFVIIDLLKREVTYIDSFLPENVEKLERHKECAFLRNLQPHYSLQVTPGEDFMTFRELEDYFLYVNYKKNILRVYQGGDFLSLKKEKRGVRVDRSMTGRMQQLKRTFFKNPAALPEACVVRAMGDTFLKDDEDDNYFYLTTEEQHQGNKEWMLHFYRAKLDLSDIQSVFQTQRASYYTAPHMTRKYKHFLLNSEFAMSEYKNDRTGKVFKNQVDLDSYVYQTLYQEFCKHTGKAYSLERFASKNKIIRHGCQLEPEFDAFCKKYGSNVLEICKNRFDLSFTALPGRISAVDLNKQEIQQYTTTFCAPAHFEIDPKENAVYASSHNFMRYEKLYFLGPAALDKFVFEDNRLVKKGTFMNDKGYRFTTHRIFYHQQHPCLCTIGHPNRLFFINARTMETIYYDDLLTDVLSDKEDVATFLNTAHLTPLTFIAFEVSADGEMLFLIGYDALYFYSFSQRKFLMSIPFHCNELFDGEIPFDKLFNYTTHTNYLV